MDICLFSLLPLELSSKILLSLPKDDFWSFCRTCSTFYCFSKDKRFWEPQIRSRFGLTLKTSNAMMYYYLCKLREPQIADKVIRGPFAIIKGNKIKMWVDFPFSKRIYLPVLNTPLQISIGAQLLAIITKKGLDLRLKRDFSSQKCYELSDLRQVACGDSHLVFIKGKELYGWGNNSYHQISPKKKKFFKKFVKIDLPSPPLQASCRNNFTAVVTDKGVYWWGKANTTHLSKSPKLLKTASKALKIFCHQEKLTVITEDGFQFCSFQGSDPEDRAQYQIPSFPYPVLKVCNNGCPLDMTIIDINNRLYYNNGSMWVKVRYKIKDMWPKHNCLYFVLREEEYIMWVSRL